MELDALVHRLVSGTYRNWLSSPWLSYSKPRSQVMEIEPALRNSSHDTPQPKPSRVFLSPVISLCHSERRRLEDPPSCACHVCRTQIIEVTLIMAFSLAVLTSHANKFYCGVMEFRRCSWDEAGGLK
jgi:hypothetical protein